MYMEISPADLAGSGFAFLVMTLLFLALTALYVVSFWQILKKAGYNPMLSLILAVPGINSIGGIIILFMLAFGKWPIYEKLSQSGAGKEERGAGE
ncbi:MAG: hypothetical protein KAU12_02220 [Candidatus Omnitrophica bacterium]|nr:hypothetical protein [Candidatus Omnitrophota bacterium]